MITKEQNINSGHRKLNYQFPKMMGSDYIVETASKQMVKYLNLDNAATTSTFKVIWEKLEEFLKSYGSIHRGSGFKSQISTAIFEESISIILNFLGVSSKDFGLVFTHNTTSAINKLSRMLSFSREDTIFISEFEHSANDLPWRKNLQIVRIRADKTGQIDLSHFNESIKKTRRGRKFVAISGASNITGALTPLHEIAKIAHTYDAHLMVDAAQLVAHREIDLGGEDPAEKIDFISFAGHKMYAPFGGGVLVGRKDLLEKMRPDDIGGGSVDFVTEDSYDLAINLFKRSTAGTPNVLGIVSMALSCEILKKKIGFNAIIEHEQAILTRSKEIFPDLKSNGIQTYCDLDYDANKKCSVLALNIHGLHPNLVAARLGHEFGIGVRQGAICQFSYVAKLLGLSPNAVMTARRSVLEGHENGMFGIVRASFGLENKPEDVDRLAEALVAIVKSPEKNGLYQMDGKGDLSPIGGHNVNISNFFAI